LIQKFKMQIYRKKMVHNLDADEQQHQYMLL
jgi:hypothetical protein